MSKIKSKSEMLKKHMKKLKKKGFKVKHIKLSDANPADFLNFLNSHPLAKPRTCEDMHIDVLVHDLMTEIDVLDIPVTSSFITALVEDIEDALERRRVTHA